MHCASQVHVPIGVWQNLMNEHLLKISLAGIQTIVRFCLYVVHIMCNVYTPNIQHVSVNTQHVSVNTQHVSVNTQHVSVNIQKWTEALHRNSRDLSRSSVYTQESP
jgi:hypothetical protein